MKSSLFVYNLSVAVMLWCCCMFMVAAGQAQDVAPAPLVLTQEEQGWLAENHVVRVRIANWPPYMFTEPVPSGIVVDYLTAIAKHFKFKVEFIPASISWSEAMQDVSGPRRHYDLLPTMSRTPKREVEYALTNDYLSAPWVIYTRNDSPYVAGPESLGGKTVAAEKGFVIADRLRSEYPEIHIIEVARSLDALEMVATGRSDAYVGNLAIANYLIRAHHLNNLVVAAPTPFGMHNQAMAVRKDWPALASLLNKGLAAMTTSEINAINQKWGAVEIRPQIDYTLVWRVSIGATLVFLIFIYWNRRLAREIAMRQRIEEDLRESERALTAEKSSLLQVQQELQQQQSELEKLITEQTEAEEALRESNDLFSHFMKHSPIYAFIKEVTPDESRSLFVSDNFVEMLGIPASAMIGKTMAEFFPPELAAKITADDWQVVTNGKVIKFNEDFKGRNYVTIKFPIVQRERRLLAGYTIDVTDQQVAAEELARRGRELSAANEELIKANYAKSLFLATMSHELRTPLNSILGLSELLLDGIMDVLTPKQAKAVTTIANSGQHLLDVITDILDLSKIEADRMELQYSLFPITDLCQLCLAFIKETAFHKQITVSSTQREVPEQFWTDQRRLKQILVNLLSNAVKFTPAGGRVGLEVTGDQSRGVVIFSVWDTGIGISPDDQEKLFQPFVQVDSSLARRFEGTGLGLALVQRLTLLMGGKVTVESEVGNGSRFGVTLPWQEVDPATDGRSPVATAAAPQTSQQPPPDSAPLILAAEDNPASLEMLSEYLSTSGYRMVTATNGRHAIEYAREQHPDLIIMDIQMPEMDGLTAIKEIRAMGHREKFIPIIALTALAMPGDRERCLEAGADHYLRKPVSMKELKDKINELLV